MTMDIKKIKNFALNIVKSLLLPLIIYLVFKLIRPETFGTLPALYIILQQAMVTTIISLGLCCNMKIGIWDFSPGAIVNLVGCICGFYFNQYGFAAMCIAGILGGIIIGFINASIYTILRIPSVVVTVGLLLIYESIATIYKGGTGFSITKKAAILGTAPWIFIVTGFMLVVMYIIYNKTKLGYNVRAIGSNELIAKSAGINPKKIKFCTFVIAGIFFGIAGIVNISYGTAVAPMKNMATMSITFDAMMSVFIAIYMSKFCNYVVAVSIGNFCMKLISAGLVTIGVDAIWQKVIVGIFLLFFISFTEIQNKTRTWMTRRKQRKEYELLETI